MARRPSHTSSGRFTKLYPISIIILFLKDLGIQISYFCGIHSGTSISIGQQLFGSGVCKQGGTAEKRRRESGSRGLGFP